MMSCDFSPTVFQACQSGHLSNRGGDASACLDEGTNFTVKISKTDLSTMQPSDAWQEEDTFVEQVKKQPVRDEYRALREGKISKIMNKVYNAKK